MDYQDASNSPTATDTTSTGSAPIARPDVDALAPGSFGPASGNTISGSGTITGTAGADTLGDAPATIVSVQGAGGTATPSSGSAQVAGQYGVLTIDPQGNFNYVRNGGTPDGVEDVFGYTLADRDGSTSSSTLTIQIGQTQSAALDGVVNLPAGVELSDIRVQGRDLVVTLPDGSTMLIPGGAVFVPQLVIGDTQVPASNVAALLVNSEAPAPAAGSLQSSGGNFANPVPPLDPGVPLGDLIPPTELAFPQPEFEEIYDEVDEEVVAGVTSAELDDDEQSNGNAGGIGDDPFGATDSGFLPGSEGDGDLEWALLTTGAPAGFSYSAGPNGSVLVFQNGNPNAVLRIDVTPATGAYTVTQLGVIAHPAGSDENNLFFPISYSVSDEDGDTAIGTLNINVDDDTPIARNDTDTLNPGTKIADGNVITAIGTTSAPGSADSPGADGLGLPNVATDGVNGILAGTSGSFTTVPVGGVTINGQFGSLLINQNGSYVYTRFDNSRAGGNDVFTYRIFDGDGDETTATLTITVPPDPIPVPVNTTAIVDDDGLVPGDQDDGLGDDPVPNNDGDGLQSTYRGTLTANFSTDGPGAEPFNFAAMNGVEQQVGQETVKYSWDAASRTLTAKIIASPDDSRENTNLFKIVLQTSGQFDVTLLQNVLHDPPGAGDPPAFENNEVIDLTFNAVDSNNDSAPGTLTLTFDDDIPTALPPLPPGEPGGPTIPRVGGLVDEDDLDEAAPQNDNVTGNDDVQPGDDSPVDASGDADPTTTGGGAGSLAALFDAGADDPLTFTLSTVTTGLPALRSGGVLLTYNVVVNDVTGVSVLTATAGLETVFTLTVNENGSWVFNLQGALDHPAPLDGVAFENNIDIDFSALVLATDADGDTVPGAPGAFVVTVDDDVPTAKPPAPPPEGSQTPTPLITGLVDEDDLSPGNTPADNSTGNQDLPVASPGDDDPDNVDLDNDGTTVGTNKPSLTTLFNPGADQPLTILLSTNTAGLVAQNLKSNGATVLYDVNVATGVLTGYVNTNGTAGFQAGDRVVFTLTVDDATGSWEFDLVDQLDHSIPGTEDNILIDFSSVITAVDKDGDPVTAQPGTFVINVDDDMPQPFDDPTNPNDPVCPEDAVATNQPGTQVLDIPLNLPPVGADEPFKLTFGVSTDPNNPTPVMDNGDPPQPVLSNGLPLFYFIDPNDPTIVEGRTSVNADPVFRIDLDPVTGTYDFYLLGDITSEITVSIPITEAIGGGNVEAKGIDVENTPFDLILSTNPGETVNTNAGFIGISGAQALEADDVVRIDFVQNVFGTSGGGGDVLNFGEYYAVNSFRQDVGGLNPQQFASFTVRAIVAVEAPSSDPSDPADGDNVFFGDTNDTTVATGTSINIYNASGTLVNLALYNATNDPGDPDIVVTANGDGSWTITGLPHQFDYEIVSDTPFNAVQVNALSDTDTFKLGAITVTRVQAVEVDFSVPITLTDADGDPVTCDIDVVLTPGVAAAAAQAKVDDDGLANANPLGTNDIDANDGDDNAGQPGDTEALFVGTLSVTGGVGDIDFRLIAPAGPVVVGQETVTISGTDGLLTGVITASPDDSRENLPLFTIELDTETGEYTVTLLRNVLHGDDANDNEDGVEVAISVSYEAKDANDDTSVGSLQVIFNDDVPFANTPTPTGLPVLIVDESPLTGAGNDGDNSDTKAFAPAFAGTFGYGADGEGDLQYTLVLNGDQVAGIGSGLFDLDPSDTDPTGGLGKGAEIMLYTNGLNVEGRIGATVYFTISVNADTGEVTLERNPDQNIWHDTTTDPDDPELLTAALNALQLRQTVIDADGDRASAVIDLSRNVFRFEDDGPSNAANGDFTKPVLIVDESPTTGAGNDGVVSASASFAGAFIPTVPPGSTDYGTDGAGTVTYKFLLTGGDVGAATNLFALNPADTDPTGGLGKGAPILLFLEADGSVTGRTSLGGTVYFTITVNGSGQVTLERNPAVNLWHDDQSNPDDPEILAMAAGANTLRLEKAVTDADGDSAKATVDLSSGVFRFEDDGPTADPDTGNVLEGGTLVVPANGVRADDDFGTDGPGTIIGVAAGSNTNQVLTTGVGTQIETSLGFLTLSANGGYTYTSKAGSVGPAGGTDTFVYTIRDADGDTSTTTLTISIGNNNLIPVATQPNPVWLDDDTISGNADGPGDRTPDTQFTTGTLEGTGGDGDLDAYLSETQTLPSGFTYAFDGAAPAGQQWLIISQGGTPVIKVTLVNESGAYTVTQLAAIDHAEDSDTEGETLLGNLISEINVSFYVQDSDVPADKSATKNLVITVDDDTPENNGTSVSVNVHEDALNSPGVAVGNNEGGKTFSASLTVAQLKGLVDAGADVPITIGLNADIEGTNTNLTQLGQPILWDYVSATQVRGLVNGDPAKVVFTLTFDAGNQEYDFVLLDNIDHDSDDPANLLTGTSDVFTEALSLASVFTATDNDGDLIVIDGGATINIENDIPAQNGATVAVTVHEDALAGGNSTGEGAKSATASITVAQLQGLVAPGADAPVVIGLNSAIEGANTNLTQLGQPILWDYVSETQVRGLVNGDPTKVVFTLTFDAGNQEYDFLLLDNIDHDSDDPANLLTGTTDAFTEALSLANVFTARDTDGDLIIIDAGATVNIENDVPTNDADTYAVGTVYEDGLPTGNLEGLPAAQPASMQILAASLAGLVSAGADSPVTITLNNLANPDPLSIEGDATGLTQNGISITWHVVSATRIDGVLNGDSTKVIFSIEDNPGDENFTFTLKDNIDHDNDPPADLTTGHGDAWIETLSLAGVFTARDTDGDAVVINDGASINIENDVPVLVLAQNMNIQNATDVAHTAAFDFNIGADENSDFDDISVNNLSVKVNNVTATNIQLKENTAADGTTAAPETSQYSYNWFTFTYNTSATTTAQATGTLVFDKLNGTYTVDLNAPISGFTTVETSNPGSVFVEANPNVTNVQIASSLFVQFTSIKEPASGDDANNLRTIDYDPNPAAPNPSPELPAPGTWEAGELFNQAQSTVQASSAAIGVGGNTVGGGEVLEFNLYSTSQGATAFNFPTASSPSMFITLDGVGTQEDFIVVLKLWNDTDSDGVIETTDSFTTRALLVQNSDIIKTTATLAGTDYANINMDNNDGVVIIEANDFNVAGGNLKIVGAQIVNSDEDVDGMAINFNGAIGGASDVANVANYQDFQLDAESQPFKVKSIGFLVQNTANQTAEIKFDVTVKDSDGDGFTQSLVATVTSNPDSVSAAAAPTPASLVTSFSSEEAFKTSSFNGPVMMAAIAAAGMESPAYAVSFDDDDGSGRLVATVTALGTEPGAAGDGSSVDASASMLAGDLAGDPAIGYDDAAASAPAGDEAADSGLTAEDAGANTQPANLDEGTDAPVAESSTSPFIAEDIMLPAEMLEPANVEAGVQHNAIVGKVLVDALNGGGDGPSLDALVNALPGGTNGLEPVATLEPASVPAGDTGDFAGFTAELSMPILEQMAMHQDAAPASA